MRIEKIFKRKGNWRYDPKARDPIGSQRYGHEANNALCTKNTLSTFFLSIIVFVCFGLECVWKICNHYKRITITSITCKFVEKKKKQKTI